MREMLKRGEETILALFTCLLSGVRRQGQALGISDIVEPTLGGLGLLPEIFICPIGNRTLGPNSLSWS